MRIRQQMVENSSEKHYAMLVSEKQLGVMTNALEEYSVTRVIDTDQALVADDMVLQITMVKGY